MNLRGLFPETAEAGGETPAKWDSPGPEEINAALEKAGLGDTPAEKPAEEKPKVETPAPAKVEEPSKVEEAPKPEEKPAEEAPAVEAKAGDKIVVDGVEYTLDDAKKWRRESMFQADYTRKTQALAEDRKTLERERKEWEAIRQQAQQEAESALPGGLPGKTRTALSQQVTRIRELLADPEIPDAMREALEIQGEMTLGVLRTMHDRDVQAKQTAEHAASERHDAQAWQTFQSTFNTLCEKNKVTDQVEREFLEARILRENADTADLDDFKSSVEKLFEHAHKGLRQRIEKERKQGQEEGKKALTVLPVAPASGAGTGNAIPLKPEPKAPQTLDDGSAVPEFLERLARLGT